MDLRAWIASDHASLLARFDSSIAAHVPESRWKSLPLPEGAGEVADDTETAAHHSSGSSIAWLLLHMTYHQDLAVNTAIRNHEPMLESRRDTLGLSRFAPSDGLTETENRSVTAAMQLPQLMAYVHAVNRATAEWIDDVALMAFETTPNTSWRLEHKAGIPADGELAWLHSSWADKPVSWFVQWEVIGHGNAHLGEMVATRNRLGLSPF